MGGLPMLGGCISLDRLASPEVEYSANAADAKSLQVPPDLTDISNGEQYILPGLSGDALSRNTLLPVFESARFIRQGGQSWLEINQAPEELWSRLLSFTRKKNYTVAQTRPVAGVITTDWRALSDQSGLLKSLIGKDAYRRIAFRLERGANGSRLFARTQQADKAFVDANTDSVWPASAHEPENTSELLTELLVFFGIEEQKAKGILNDAAAANLMDDATIQTTAGGSVLVMHKGFRPSFRSLRQALSDDGFDVTQADFKRGQLEANLENTDYIFLVAPVHVSASKVSVAGSGGERLSAETEKALLSKLQQHLI
jgi:outer membrane protein assembly factor BamC